MAHLEYIYRFVFVHLTHETVTLQAQGPTRCIAKGFAWQYLESQLRSEGFERDQYWKLQEQTPLGVVSIG